MRRTTYCSYHSDDVGMSVFGQHSDFVVELTQQFFAYVGIEYLFHCDFQFKVLSFVDCAESSHWYLLSDLQVAHFYHQNPVNSLPLWLNLHKIWNSGLKSPVSIECLAWSSWRFLLFEDTGVPFDALIFWRDGFGFIFHEPRRRLLYFGYTLFDRVLSSKQAWSISCKLSFLWRFDNLSNALLIGLPLMERTVSLGSCSISSGSSDSKLN